ncbi:hypothetical protein [Verrucomicrobium sp. BvORR106]|uniref:hypothetical protein n=1 Tax=Verrucomicrobium sp. BvORR106 TaxID=1403819 RepID=UPI00056FD8E7|nr:hypothetical protein [Verrucomicrobium sp. BvORR106]
MKLEIPGQLRGSDTRVVMRVLIQLRREWEGTLASLECNAIHLISPIARVGGILGTFGPDGLENIKVESGEAECDVVIAPRDWNSMTEEEVTSVVRPMLLEAIAALLAKAGCHELPIK